MKKTSIREKHFTRKKVDKSNETLFEYSYDTLDKQKNMSDQ